MERLPSGKELLILGLLAQGREMYGLELVEASSSALKRGTVYVTLGRMEEKGLVTSRQEPLPEGAIGLPRRLYAPTALGLRALAAVEAARLVLSGGTAS
jgi:DNA-binding PadR family transcriptional regulator